MAYIHELTCAGRCGRKNVSVEVIGRYNYSEGLFCSACGKRRLKALQKIETENSQLEKERPDLIGKLR